jgi:hypothetical protein
VPREPHAHHLIDSEVAPELDELPDGPVFEPLHAVLPAVDSGQDVAGDHVALLDRGLRGRRDDLAVLLCADVLDGCAVSYRPDVIVTLDAQVLVHLNAGPLVHRKAGSLDAEVRTVAGGPDHVLRIYCAAALELHAVFGYLLGHGARPDLDALVDHPGAGGLAQRGIQLRQDVRESFEQENADAVRVYVRVVRGQVLVDEGVDLRGHLDPGRAAAYDHEGQLGLGHLAPDERDLLKAFYDPIADALGVLDTPHGQAVLLYAGDAEEVGQATQRDEDVVEGELYTAVGHHDFFVKI